MIEIRGLSFAYQPGQPVLHEIDLDLRPGERVSILGPNGSGKSTLLRCISGLLKPTAGSILARRTNEDGGGPLRIGLVFQNPDDQIVSPVVESEVAFGLENLGVPHPEMVMRVDAVLERFNLTQYRQQDPHLLSGGERQRLAIASIVVTRPDFLLFDEPFSFLDPAFRDELDALIASLNDDGITPVVVGQDPDEALDADRLLICAQGRIEHDSRPENALAHPERLRAYGLASTTAGRLAEALGIPSPVPVIPVDLIQSARTISYPPVTEVPRRPPCEEAIIEVADLRFAYNHGLPTEHVALKGIDLTVCKGDILTLMGPSGSGKSTLALHLNGLHTPTSGLVNVAGLDASDPKTHDQLRQQVGLVFQFPETQLFAETVADDVAYGPRNHGMDDISGRADRALEAVGLPPDRFRGRSPFTLSGGEKRRVTLAGVLATSPSILVLDEPTAGLDRSGADELDNILVDLNRSGVTIVMITHDLCRAAALSNRIVGIKEGRVIVDLPTAAFFSESTHLDALGLRVPTGIELVSRLREGGFAIPEPLLTSDQLVAQLRRSG